MQFEALKLYLKDPNIYLKLSLYLPNYVHLHLHIVPFLDCGNPNIICDKKNNTQACIALNIETIFVEISICNSSVESFGYEATSYHIYLKKILAFHRVPCRPLLETAGLPPGDLRSKISRKFWRLGILAGRRPRRKRPAPLAKRREAHSPRPKISRKFWGLGAVFTRLLNFREILEIRFQNFREILETKISGKFWKRIQEDILSYYYYYHSPRP